MATQTKPQDDAGFQGKVGLEAQGLDPKGDVHWNLVAPVLIQNAIRRNEGQLADMGPFCAVTTPHTGRSPNDKFLVKESSSAEDVDWGKVNQPLSDAQFATLLADVREYLSQRDELFIKDLYCGADPKYRLSVRYVSPGAWHMAFVRNMFIRPEATELPTFDPNFTVLHAPEFEGDPAKHGIRTTTFIGLNLAERMMLIGGTRYAGELKKAMFTVMQYYLPKQGVLSMHCSANIGPAGDTALFFGLSGTGKTTLSADPNRSLIGDDEHGWGVNGVFNFEDGCYAKVIRLSPEAEPQIWECTRRFGTILENVVYDPFSRRLDLNDDRLTENTRGAYPLDYIDNSLPDKMAGHPSTVVFLTCDASGVMPPISRLSADQAIYHFISGYTSKIAGTEIRLGKEPEITFSACFGGPFMVHTPYTYASLLRRKIERYGADCWLVNTGWVGGPYGVGKRISIRYTRDLLNAALDGKLKDVEYTRDPIFGFAVPKTCPGVPDHVLRPADAWHDKEHYTQKYRQLAARFVENFRKFAVDVPPEVVAAGPVLEAVATRH